MCLFLWVNSARRERCRQGGRTRVGTNATGTPTACGPFFASVSGWRTQSRASPRATDSKAFGLKSACSRHCNGAAVVHRRVLAVASTHQLRCKNSLESVSSAGCDAAFHRGRRRSRYWWPVKARRLLPRSQPDIASKGDATIGDATISQQPPALHEVMNTSMSLPSTPPS